MKLVNLFSLREAGLPNAPTKEPKKKKSTFKHANGGAMGSTDDDEEEDDLDLGPDMDYEDPAEDPPAKIDRSAIAKPEPEKPKAIPFSSKSEPPSKALQGGKTAGSINADGETLGALSRALQSVRTQDDDLQDWIDDVLREIGRAVKSGSQLTLPKFEATPSLDDFDDDGSEDEDY